MIFSPDTADAARYCLNNNIRFALYAMPGNETPIFLADDGSTARDKVTGSDGFFVNTFGNTLPKPEIIHPKWDCRSVMNQPGNKSTDNALNRITESSTPREKYIRDIDRLTAELKRDGGKTVISRVICGSSSGIDWVKVAERYFTAYPTTFRFLYYTPVTGAWLGATPEIILSRDSDGTTLTTMSLAGTRKCSDMPWDDKNIAEHNFVTEYIVAILKESGLSPEVHDAENVAYGDIEHLCNRITADYNGDIMQLLHRLSPTPALAGTPLSAAMRHISTYESHQRNCYGGYVGISDSTGTHAFVNLRSVNFDKDSFCVYAGGGITASSVAADEWSETEAKVSKLLSIIKSESYE